MIIRIQYGFTVIYSSLSRSVHLSMGPDSSQYEEQEEWEEEKEDLLTPRK